MSDIKLISPMLDNFNIGDPISDHHGIRCCPAMRKDSDEKYIVKIISVPASQVQYDALLLTGICSDRESALAYFNGLVNNIIDEIKNLQKLSDLEGFLPMEDYQIVPMEDDVGYDIYILSKYKRTLAKQFQRQPMTHLGVINLGLDLCAALSVARKLGYIYADLKPSNIYLSGDQEYRIGDIGFIKLESLQYASLPEAYRSAYTAPEITDAYSALNTTIDIYALGLILYQTYNGGALPVADEETGAFSPPAYADYEMSEIIMKACALNAEDRWQDPIEMGQALVAYMQRNGANDTPIIQYVPADPVEETPETVQDAEPEEASTDEAQQEQNSDPYIEDEMGNLSFLADNQDETVPGEEDAEVDYEEVTEEVSEILAVADELISHPTPDPVVAPEPVDVPFPAPVEPEPEITDAEENNEERVAEIEDSVQVESEETPSTNDVIEESSEPEDSTASEESAEHTASEAEDSTPDDDVTCETNQDSVTSVDDESDTESTEKTVTEENDEPSAPKKKFAWWKGLLIGLLIAGIGVAGYFYYTLYYLQPASIALSGYDNKLTVTVDCEIEDIYVICNDAYGNQHKAFVMNGKAEFDDLAGNTAYTVTVKTDKFYKLTGNTTATYQTAVQTKIINFTALNGTEAGNVVLSFVVDGTDSEQWRLYYAQANTAEESQIFSGHTISLSNLNIGNEYTFRLEPVSELFFDPENALTFTPAIPVKAENLSIAGYTADSITVNWTAPENANVEKWIVRCYDGTSFVDPIETSELTATFTGVDPKNTYTIEVFAENMSESAKITASEGTLSLRDFQVEQNSGLITLSWNASDEATSNGWTVSYAIGDTTPVEISVSSGNKCEDIPYIPNADYAFTVKAADGRETINNQHTFKSEAAPVFKNYGVGAEHIHFDMCKTPTVKNWTVRNLVSSDFTTSFSASGKASYLLSIPYAYQEPNDDVVITYAVFDENGKYISNSVVNGIWGEMWDRGYCELDIPSIPSETGNYKMAVYFNGAVVNENSFTIIP